MQTVSKITTAHVRRAVCHHEFTSSVDWAIGLDELAGFSDAEIDALANDGPSVLIIFQKNVPLDRIANGLAAWPIIATLQQSELSNPRHGSSRTLDHEEKSAGVGTGDS